MSRPQKPKRVCGEPLIKKFLPDDNKGKRDMVTMSLDEYETIRLIDLEGILIRKAVANPNTVGSGKLTLEPLLIAVGAIIIVFPFLSTSAAKIC